MHRLPDGDRSESPFAQDVDLRWTHDDFMETQSMGWSLFEVSHPDAAELYPIKIYDLWPLDRNHKASYREVVNEVFNNPSGNPTIAKAAMLLARSRLACPNIPFRFVHDVSIR